MPCSSFSDRIAQCKPNRLVCLPQSRQKQVILLWTSHQMLFVTVTVNVLSTSQMYCIFYSFCLTVTDSQAATVLNYCVVACSIIYLLWNTGPGLLKLPSITSHRYSLFLDIGNGRFISCSLIDIRKHPFLMWTTTLLQTPPGARVDLNKVREAKRFAVLEAQHEGCLGSYKSFDSLFGNYLVPVIPTNDFFHQVGTKWRTEWLLNFAISFKSGTWYSITKLGHFQRKITRRPSFVCGVVRRPPNLQDLDSDKR